MEKIRGWKIGLISKDLTSAFGTTIKKGTEVHYRRQKSLSDDFGYKLTDYEWHYKTENQFIRSSELIIEGLEYIQEPYKK